MSSASPDASRSTASDPDQAKRKAIGLRAHLGEIAELLIPPRRERTCSRAVKRTRHNSYRAKKPGEPASIRHRSPATITIRELKTQVSLRGIGR